MTEYTDTFVVAPHWGSGEQFVSNANSAGIKVGFHVDSCPPICLSNNDHFYYLRTRTDLVDELIDFCAQNNIRVVGHSWNDVYEKLDHWRDIFQVQQEAVYDLNPFSKHVVSRCVTDSNALRGIKKITPPCVFSGDPAVYIEHDFGGSEDQFETPETDYEIIRNLNHFREQVQFSNEIENPVKIKIIAHLHACEILLFSENPSHETATLILKKLQDYLRNLPKRVTDSVIISSLQGFIKDLVS